MMARKSLADLRVQEVTEYGADAQRGNLLGIQPSMVPADNTSADTFRAKIDGYLGAASRTGWLGERTIVVLPEYVGTWLVVAGGKPGVHQAETVARAMRALVLSDPVRFASALLRGGSRDRVKGALFRTQAARMAEIYDSVFSGLAREYGVTIVAGSIVLPSPEVKSGRLVIGRGALHNTSVVYGPNGLAYEDVVRKVFPIQAELSFTAPGSVSGLPVFDTPAGRVAVLVCADSWYPAPYEAIVEQRAEIVAVPSYLAPCGIWEQTWRGYDGAPAPADVDARDVGRIAEGEAWIKYALAGRLARTEIEHGINVFLRGDLWDLGSDGHTIVVRARAVLESKHAPGAAIVNSWL